MLRIRLSRTGRRNLPTYRVIVAEHSRQPKGKFLHVLGWYNPTQPDKPFQVDVEAVKEWISKGAQPSNTVAKLLNKNEGFNLAVLTKAPKPKEEEAAPAAAPAQAEPAGEAPAEEAPAEEVSSEAEITEEQSAEEPAAEAALEEAPAETEEASPEAEAVEETPAETEAEEDKSETAE